MKISFIESSVVCYTSVTDCFHLRRFLASMCNTNHADRIIATKPRNTFWKAIKKVLEGFVNYDEFLKV